MSTRYVVVTTVPLTLNLGGKPVAFAAETAINAILWDGQVTYDAGPNTRLVRSDPALGDAIHNIGDTVP